jgi:ABC-type multidrug transport system ATPase subunit
MDVTQHVGRLAVSAKQKVEILKTLYRNAEVIILDEPTAVLTPQETEVLFDNLKHFKEMGHTILFISHKLNEVKGYEMLFDGNNLTLFLVGNLVAFVVALLAIKFFIEILKKYGFKMWGWYRIILGIAFIAYETMAK